MEGADVSTELCQSNPPLQKRTTWPVVVAQLVEWSLPKPEVRGSNPVINKLYIKHSFTVNCI